RLYTLKVWNAATGQEIFSANEFMYKPLGISFSPDGNSVAVAYSGGQIRSLDARTGRVLLHIEDGGLGRWLCLSPDGKRMARDHRDMVEVWDLETGKTDFQLRREGGLVHGLAYTADGTRLATGGNIDTIEIWDLPGSKKILTLKGHGGTVGSLCFSAD